METACLLNQNTINDQKLMINVIQYCTGSGIIVFFELCRVKRVDDRQLHGWKETKKTGYSPVFYFLGRNSGKSP